MFMDSMCSYTDTMGPTQQTSTAARKRSYWALSLFIILVSILTRHLSNAKTRYRLYSSFRAFYSLATLPSEDWAAYYESMDTVMTKDAIETPEDERRVGAWYKVVNYFCDLGNLEKMYIPPLVDPALGLEDNQVLIENRMALGAASQSWNASFINKVGDTLPSRYKKRYVINAETNEKSILPVGHDVPTNFQQREMEIVELGCGKGRIMYDMVRYTHGKAVGVNIDVSQLKNAMQFALDKDLWPHRMNFVHGTYNDKLPFDDASVDFVYEVGAFTYMIDKVSVFQEIFRVLRPGGAFCYNDWAVLAGFDPHNPHQVAAIQKIKKFSGLIELHRPEELKAVAEQAGFEVIWNNHGGHLAKPSTGLLGEMEKSFRYADLVMDFLIKNKILPKSLIKSWGLVRGGGGTDLLLQSMDQQWLDVGHIFLVRKPFL
jgi:sterol 24-C-methyltransferase